MEPQMILRHIRDIAPPVVEPASILLILDAPEASLTVEFDSDVDIYSLACRFREFALALGYAPESVDAIIDPRVMDEALARR